MLPGQSQNLLTWMSQYTTINIQIVQTKMQPCANIGDLATLVTRTCIRLNNRDIKKEKMNKAKPQLTEMSTCERTL